MRLFYATTFGLLSLLSFASFAADPNGYISVYECRAGGSACNINISALATAPCDVTVTPSDRDWSKITNSSARVFCLTPGDHTAKGALVLSSSGTASARKVLRYYNPSDADDEPWNQAESNRATVIKLDFAAADYWFVHRITVDGYGQTQDGVFIRTGSDNNLLNRVLVQRHHGYQIIADWNGPSDGNVVQNSVVRKAVLDTVFEAECIDAEHSSNFHLVNNEVYDCHKAFSVGSGVPDVRGLVVENNDFYVSTDFYTDCNGHFNGVGPCSGSEGVMSIKSGGIATSPARYLHNRIWGGRPGDGNLVGWDSSGSGTAVSISASGPDNPGLKTDYLLFMNNIVMDSQRGITGWWGPDQNDSIIGNIIYNIHAFNVQAGDSLALEINSKQNSEWYLNTVIDTDMWLRVTGSDTTGGSSSGNDVRCNVVINGGASSISPGAVMQIDNNVFYNTSMYTTASGSNLNMTRANASDAKMQPYCFYRKLRTGAEQVCIPNAKPQTTSPHYQACDASLGTRMGVGVSDESLF